MIEIYEGRLQVSSCVLLIGTAPKRRCVRRPCGT